MERRGSSIDPTNLGAIDVDVQPPAEIGTVRPDCRCGKECEPDVTDNYMIHDFSIVKQLFRY